MKSRMMLLYFFTAPACWRHALPLLHIFLQHRQLCPIVLQAQEPGRMVVTNTCAVIWPWSSSQYQKIRRSQSPIMKSLSGAGYCSQLRQLRLQAEQAQRIGHDEQKAHEHMQAGRQAGGCQGRGRGVMYNLTVLLHALRESLA